VDFEHNLFWNFFIAGAFACTTLNSKHMKQPFDLYLNAYLQTHPTCIKSLQLKFPGVEPNELVEAVRRAGPEKDSIYKFVERHFKAGKPRILSGKFPV
jgi:hypothetical protein